LLDYAAYQTLVGVPQQRTLGASGGRPEMCGIAGLVSSDRLDRSAPARAVAMRETMVHRGPDEAGCHCDANAALAHRRLSIVDLSTGQQPLSNEDGSVWIVFNGEIYNHAEIRAVLENHGHRYRTRSDTETIVHAYEQWGDDCVHQLRGMFAFAVWDAPRRRLLLARDRLGVKPLYWARIADLLIFGSEIKAILASGLLQPEANIAVLPEVLSTRAVAGTETMFRGVYKLLPGHVLTYEHGEIKTLQYWDLPQRSQRSQAPSPGQSGVSRFRELLEESVRLRLMS
jgi:asparagine synthase (glutamine-hydrolysing)